jgi:hypothetical protein
VFLLVQLQLQPPQQQKNIDFVHRLTLQTKIAFLKDAAAEAVVRVQYVQQELSIDVHSYKGENK